MFGKSYSWWFGENSFWHHIGGERILIGALGGTATYPKGTPSSSEAEYLKYGFLILGAYVVVKAIK
tara:strand:- start:1129 stop:1326 length:198 start_codon:yes stop_codon:yes gene_type:complete